MYQQAVQLSRKFNIAHLAKPQSFNLVRNIWIKTNWSTLTKYILTKGYKVCLLQSRFACSLLGNLFKSSHFLLQIILQNTFCNLYTVRTVALKINIRKHFFANYPTFNETRKNSN